MSRPPVGRSSASLDIASGIHSAAASTFGQNVQVSEAKKQSIKIGGQSVWQVMPCLVCRGRLSWKSNEK